MKILNPVMYSNFGPVTIEDGEKKYVCKIEFFDDHQVLHEITSEEEMEKCRKNYQEYLDVM